MHQLDGCRRHADHRQQPAHLERRRPVEGEHAQVVPRRRAGGTHVDRHRSVSHGDCRTRRHPSPAASGRGHRHRRRHDPSHRRRRPLRPRVRRRRDAGPRRAAAGGRPVHTREGRAARRHPGRRLRRRDAPVRRRSSSIAIAGTGPNMACGNGTLLEYLILALNVLCGRYLRAGDLVWDPKTLVEQMPRVAQAMPPFPAYGFGAPFRVKGLADTVNGPTDRSRRRRDPAPGRGADPRLHQHGWEPARHVARPAEGPRRVPLPGAAGADRPVDVGDGQASALRDRADAVVRGARDQQHVRHDLRRVPGCRDAGPWAQYTPALVEPPAGSDVIPEWEFFYGVAARMGLQTRVRPIDFGGGQGVTTTLDMEHTPTPTSCSRSSAPTPGSRSTR